MSDPNAYEPQPRFRDRINWPATIASSIAATALATYAVHGREYEQGSPINRVHSALTVNDHRSFERSTGSTLVIKKSTKFEYTPLNSRTLLKSSIHNPSERWAEQFADDPHAGELTHQQDFEKIVASVQSLSEQGFNVDAITLTGYSSAEDDNSGAGLDTRSEKNIELAQRRAEVVAETLKTTFSQDPKLKKATEGIKFKFGEPQEQTLDEQQIEKINQTAKQTGYASAEAMIKTWNRNPSELSQDSKGLLDKMLGQARKVDITISSKHPAKIGYRQDKYCVVENITNEHIEQVEREDHLSFPIIIPIPIFKRRRKQSDAEDENDIGPDENKNTSEVTEVSDEERLARTQREREAQWAKSDKRARRIATSIGSVAAGLLLLVNISGKDCDNKTHSPWPWPVEFGASVFGHNDAAQKFSIGIPFARSLQLVESGYSAPLFNIPSRDENGVIQEICAKTPKAAVPQPNPTTNPCKVIEVTKRNGKVVKREVIQPGEPLSSTFVKNRP